MKKNSFEEHCLWDLMSQSEKRYANSLTGKDYDLFIESANDYWEENNCYDFVLKKLFADTDMTRFI